MWLLVVFAVFLACFNFSYGPVCWIIVSEIFPTAIRGRAMSISIFSLWTGCTLVAQTFPRLLARLGPRMDLLALRLDHPAGIPVRPLPRPRDQGQVARTDRKTVGALSWAIAQSDGENR